MLSVIRAALMVGLLLTARTALASGEGGGESSSSLLDVNLGSAVWNLLWFLLLAIILGKFVWPKVLQGLKAREERIRRDIASAQEANQQAQQTLEQYQRELANAHAEARQIVEQSRKDAEQVRSQLTRQAEEEAERIRQRANEEIQLAKQEALNDLYGEVAGLATDVAAKLLQRSISEEDARQLADQSVEELKRANQSAGASVASRA